MSTGDRALDAKIPAATLRMLLPYFEAMDRTGRKWFLERLKTIKARADFNYPNGKPMQPEDRVPTRPVWSPNDF